MTVPTSPPGRGAATGTGLAVTSVASVQFGAALAAHLFPVVGSVGTVALRMVGASMAMLALTRPWRLSWTWFDVRVSALFAAVFVGMNLSLYGAIERLPLATAITLEFLGPLGVSVCTSRSWAQRIWVLPAGAGVAVLGGTIRGGDRMGLVLALTAAGCWACYILLSRRIGRDSNGLARLTFATLLGVIVVVPLGAVAAGSELVRPSTVATGLAVGVLSSAIPYSLDMLALRRLPTAVFGVLTSLNPAVAALAGYLVLDQQLGGRQIGGIALVTAASVGVTLAARRTGRLAPISSTDLREAKPRPTRPLPL